MSSIPIAKQKKRFAIAHAAGVLFGDRGFERVKMADVALAAGVGKGTIYEYFKNKEELIDGAFELVMSVIAENMRSANDLDSPPLETLKKITAAMVEVMEHFGHGYRFFLEYMLYCSRRGDGFHIFKDMLEELRAEISRLLQAAINSGDIRKNIHVEKTSAVFCAWFDGAIFHWIVIPEKPSLQEMADVYLDTFFNGVINDKKEDHK